MANVSVIKTALVTGASSGIGYNLARLFAQNGHQLILVSRTESDLQRVADELVTQYKCPAPIVIPKDLSKLDAAQELFEETERQGLQVNYLVNDAGTGQGGLFMDQPIEKDEEMIILNVWSFLRLTKLYLAGMLKRNEGRILQVGSILGVSPAPLLATYAATKAFVGNLTDALINEIKDSNVTMTLLMPGITNTGFWSEEKQLAQTRTGQNLDKSGDDPKDVAYNGYTAMMKGEHRAYGSTKVKLLTATTHIMPNEVLSAAIRSTMEKDDK